MYFVYFAINMGTMLNTHFSRTNRRTKNKMDKIFALNVFSF